MAVATRWPLAIHSGIWNSFNSHQSVLFLLSFFHFPLLKYFCDICHSIREVCVRFVEVVVCPYSFDVYRCRLKCNIELCQEPWKYIWAIIWTNTKAFSKKKNNIYFLNAIICIGGCQKFDQMHSHVGLSVNSFAQEFRLSPVTTFTL